MREDLFPFYGCRSRTEMSCLQFLAVIIFHPFPIRKILDPIKHVYTVNTRDQEAGLLASL